jgi:hypothetical protein
MFSDLKDANVIKDFRNYGLVFNLELNNIRAINDKFEQILSMHGLHAGMWNEGGQGLLIIVPLDMDQTYLIDLRNRLTLALRDYASAVSLSS